MTSLDSSEQLSRQEFFICAEEDVNLAVLKTGRLEMTSFLPPTERTLLATTVAELARNIVKYARRGVVRLTRLEEPTRVGIRIEAQDQGPGIADLESALGDHVSTGGTLGLGLPGVKRMMDEFRIESTPGKGTQVTTCKWIRRRQ